MGQLVYILGRSGTGKSYSMRNLDKGSFVVINVQGKILPFKGSGKVISVNCDDSADIVTYIKSYSKQFKIIVVDDFQYVMANEFMRRAMERGYDKFTEIARHAWDIAECVRSLPKEVIVYVMCHTDTDADGIERLKTIGKLLDEKIVLEGMSTIVLKTNVSDGKYCFITQNNGKDTTKSPAGMFPSYAIDNDLKYVDDKIRSYYEFDGAKSEEEMAEEDDAAKTDIQPEEKRSRRSRRGKEEEEKPSKTPEEEKKEESGETAKSEEPETRRRRRRGEITEPQNDNFMDIPEDAGEDGVPFDELERKPRKEPVTETASSEEENDAPVRRRRRRV